MGVAGCFPGLSALSLESQNGLDCTGDCKGTVQIIQFQPFATGRDASTKPGYSSIPPACCTLVYFS